MTTMRHMCETIAKSKILGDKTPVEIFNYSSCGELFMVFDWYEVAKSHLNLIASLSNSIATHHTKYNWAAQDADGEIHEYINKPSTEEAAGPWWGKACIGNSRQASDPTTKVVTNWKESLIDLSKNDYIIKDGILMATRKHAALIHAWADGAEIEYFNKDNLEWMKVVGNNPSWFDDTEYRIKPKTKTVKFRTYVYDGKVDIAIFGSTPVPNGYEWIDKEWREVEVEA